MLSLRLVRNPSEKERFPTSGNDKNVKTINAFVLVMSEGVRIHKTEHKIQIKKLWFFRKKFENHMSYKNHLDSCFRRNDTLKYSLYISHSRENGNPVPYQVRYYKFKNDFINFNTRKEMFLTNWREYCV